MTAHPINFELTWVRDTELDGRAFPANASHLTDRTFQLWINGMIQHLAAIEVTKDDEGCHVAVGPDFGYELASLEHICGCALATTTLPGIDDESIWVIYLTPAGA